MAEIPAFCCDFAGSKTSGLRSLVNLALFSVGQFFRWLAQYASTA